MQTTDRTEKRKIPNPVVFILQTPLYEDFKFEGMEAWDVIALMYFKGTLDCYCPGCGKNATFKGITPEPPGEHIRNPSRDALLRVQGAGPDNPKLKSGPFEVVLQCTRTASHIQHYFFLIIIKIEILNKQYVTHTSVMKIGQHPSYGDLNLTSIKKYRTVLDETLLRELSRAIALASHDVGVGSYIYLRRVFESLIEDAHQIAKKDKKWSEQKYIKSRMSEKIKALKNYLPTFLVENPTMYSLLSKGVHELSEQECMDHFPTLKIGIELILDQKLEKKEQEQKIQQAKAALQKATEKMKEA